MKKEERSFAIIIGSVALLWIFAIVFSTVSTSVTGHATSQPLSFVKAGQVIELGARDIPGLSVVKLTFRQQATNTRVAIDVNNNIPFDGTAYSKFTISGLDPVYIREVELSLSLDKKRLREISLQPSDVRVYKNGKSLTPTFTKEDETYLHYFVHADTMGDFVIGRQAEKRAVAGQAVLPPAVKETPAPAVVPQEEPAQPVSEKKMTFWQRVKSWFN
ncbi:hypothetical protein COV20_06425 [Candidatus Woesearchaeota archaeon CG10_big_fil_rev_8_21_14_0_10_45_16]|nr:MAG: hypothetical protein COV20_06425 [Candidatus Woesearchaeota archaeon CG10_big_fil_rev_8_21_14_0_10_45_16]